MSIIQIERIERLSLILVAAATLVSLVFWTASITLGTLVGGGLAALNFIALRRLVQAIVQGSQPRKQAMMVILLALKLGVLAASLFLIIRYLPVHPLALVVGISIVVISIFAEGFRTVLTGASAPTD